SRKGLPTTALATDNAQADSGLPAPEGVYQVGHVGWDGGGPFAGGAVGGMDEGDSRGVQGLASEVAQQVLQVGGAACGDAQAPAITRVAYQRVANMGHMDADL